MAVIHQRVSTADATIRVSGFYDVWNIIAKVDKHVRVEGQRRAMEKAIVPIINDAKSRINPVWNNPPSTGLLRDSIKGRVVNYYKSGTVVGIIGSSMQVTGIRQPSRPYWPWNIAHIVERGTKVTDRNQPYPFLRPAFESMIGTTIKIYKSVVGKEISMAAKQLKGKTSTALAGESLQALKSQIRQIT